MSDPCAPDPAADRAVLSACAALPDGEVLVTGGAGFIGSHLVEMLLAAGRRVHVVDDLSTGSLDNLGAVRQSARLRITQGSVAQRAVAEPAVAAAACVFHLAGMVGVQRLAAQPLLVMQGNLGCTQVMLECAAARRTPILIASSSEVYGHGSPPFVETDPVQPGATTGLRGGYAAAKAMGEWLAMGHRKEHGLPVVVARLFNVVGPRQSGAYGMVLPRFLAQAQQGQPITVFGDGSQTRCFGAVDEVCRALTQLLGSPAAHGQVVNVGSDQEVTVLQLAKIVQRASASASSIVRVPHDAVFPAGFFDPPRRVPDLSLLRALLGWAPDRPIEAIVAAMAGRPAAARRSNADQRNPDPLDAAPMAARALS